MSRGWGSTRRWRQLRAAQIAKSIGRPCEICGRLLLPHEKLHADHRVARKWGGRDSADNVRIVHARCNLSRGAGSGAGLGRVAMTEHDVFVIDDIDVAPKGWSFPPFGQ